MFRYTLLTTVVCASILLNACLASKYHLSGVDITPRRCKGNDDCPSGQCFQGTCVVSYGESAVFSSADAPLGVKDYTPRVAAGPATILYVDKSNKQSKPQYSRYATVTIYHDHDLPTISELCDSPETMRKEGSKTTRAVFNFEPKSVTETGVIQIPKVSLDVVTSGPVRAIFRICPDDSLYENTDDSSAIPGSWVNLTNTNKEMDGRWILKTELEFRNPYGYLPAHLYGLVPFFAFHAGFVALLVLFFLVQLFRYRTEIISIHYAILIIMALTLVGSLLYFVTFAEANKTGQPICYPSCHTLYLISMVVDELKNTMARLLILIVCLGLGVVKPELSFREKWQVVSLHLAYFVFSINENFRTMTSLESPSEAEGALWALPPVMLNVFILCWIYYALSKTQANLVTQGQTYKHKMYVKLANLLSGLVVIWSLSTVVLFLARMNVLQWPWQMEWFWFAVWHFIFYLALVGIAFQWGPSDNSGGLSHQMQLSVVDDDIEVDLEMVDVDDSEVADPNMFSIDFEDTPPSSPTNKTENKEGQTDSTSTDMEDKN